jgi:hypothetical protein
MTKDTHGQTDFQPISNAQLAAQMRLLVIALETPEEEALEDLTFRLGQGETIPSQQHLSTRWRRPKQTVSDWLTRWRSQGLVPQPVQAGRCKSIIA